MAQQTRPRITRKTVDSLACELHQQLIHYPTDAEIDHVFAALIPRGLDPSEPNVLNAISPTDPVLLHMDSNGRASQAFDDQWDFLAFSMRGEVIKHLQNMNLPKGTGLFAVNLLTEGFSQCHQSNDQHACDESIHRLSIVISNRYSAGVVSDGTNQPMFFKRNGGLLVAAMQKALSRAN
jgi:hypothetical protein